MDEVLVLLVGAVFVVVAALFFVTRWQRKKEDNADSEFDWTACHGLSFWIYIVHVYYLFDLSLLL